DAVSYKAQMDNLRREGERLRLKSEQAAEHLASLALELQQLSQADEALQARLGAARQGLVDQRQERERLRGLRDTATQRVADLRAQHSGLTSRIEVLDDLERSHEGLGTGVREVLSLLLGEAPEDRGGEGETQRHGDTETRRQGDTETRRAPLGPSPCLPVSPSPGYLDL